MRCARKLFSAGRFRGRPTPLCHPEAVTFLISHKKVAVDGEGCCRWKRHPRRPNNRPVPWQRSSPFNHPSLVIPSVGWASGPPKVMKKASVRQLLFIEPLPLPLSSRVLDGPGGPPKKMNMRPEPHVRRSEAEGSAVPRTFLGNVFRRSEAEGSAVPLHPKQRFL